MPVPRKEIVQSVLSSHRESIAGAVLGGWRDWFESPYIGAWRCRRSRANFVWEQIIRRAHFLFDGVPSVRVIEGHETFKFLVNNTVLFRFKKGDDAGLSANIPTQLALAFHDHDKNLLDLPPVHRVDIVYRLNRLETAIDDVIVVARDEKKLAWSYSLLDSDSTVVPLPSPGPNNEPDAALTRRVVQPRGAAERRNQGM